MLAVDVDLLLNLILLTIFQGLNLKKCMVIGLRLYVKREINLNRIQLKNHKIQRGIKGTVFGSFKWKRIICMKIYWGTFLCMRIVANLSLKETKGVN